MVPGESLIATRMSLLMNSSFKDIFPGNPVMPGVLIIESLAQAYLF